MCHLKTKLKAKKVFFDSDFPLPSKFLVCSFCWVLNWSASAPEVWRCGIFYSLSRSWAVIVHMLVKYVQKLVSHTLGAHCCRQKKRNESLFSINKKTILLLQKDITTFSRLLGTTPLESPTHCLLPNHFSIFISCPSNITQNLFRTVFINHRIT